MSGRVLFVGGWGRSGSTLLERLVGQVDGVVSVGEMRDLWRRGVVEGRLCGCGEPFADCPRWSAVGHAAFGGWDALDVERAEALRRRVDRPWRFPGLLLGVAAPGLVGADVREYARLLARVYDALGSVTGGAVVVDSTKIPTFALLLRMAGQDVRVVHLVRDSRGVMHSWAKQKQRRDATTGADVMLRYGALSGSGRYLLYNLMTQALASVLPYRRARYEDLVRAPARTVRDVLASVDEAAPAELLDGLERRRLRVAPTHTVDGNPMRLEQGRELRISADEGWRTAMAPRSRLLVTALTAPLLLAYGYLGRSSCSRRPRGAAS